MESYYGRTRRAAAKTPRRPEGRLERSRSAGSLPASNPQQIETEFAELKDGTLIEVVQHPTDPTKTLLAIYENGSVRLEERFESDGRVFVPKARDSGIFSRVRLPKGVAPCESVRSLQIDTIGLLSKCLDADPISLQLLSFFILSTWFPEKLTVAPYLALVGMPRSGKTTLLRLLELLCRHSILVADITCAAFYEVYQETTPTLLIDETSTAAAEQRKLFHLLRSSSTRGPVGLRKGASFSGFGPKVFAWIELPNDRALNTRCVIHPMSETSRIDLVRPTDPRVLRAADHFQQQALQLRLEKFNVSPRPNVMAVKGVDQLHSRNRDLYEALAFPVADDTSLCAMLAWHISKQEQFTREPLSARQMAVLGALAVTVHSPESSATLVGELASRANSVLEAQGESLTLTAHAVGEILTTFGINNRSRTNKGWSVAFDQELRKKIHQMIQRHGAGGGYASAIYKACPGCQFCKEVQL